MNVCQPSQNECCMNSTILNDEGVKYFFIAFTNPLSLIIHSEELLWRKKIKYLSHISKADDENHCAYFRMNETILPAQK